MSVRILLRSLGQVEPRREDDGLHSLSVTSACKVQREGLARDVPAVLLFFPKEGRGGRELDDDLSGISVL